MDVLASLNWGRPLSLSADHIETNNKDHEGPRPQAPRLAFLVSPIAKGQVAERGT